jgi:hypothetical protein
MEPPASDDNAFATDLPEGQPKTSIPKTIGIMNIVFGSLLLTCVCCSGVNLVMQSAMIGPVMAVQQKQIEQAMQVERQQRLQELQQREQAANDEKEKADLKAQQKVLQGRPIPKMPDFTKFMQDPRYLGFEIVDLVTGLVLDILMVVSGIALLNLKEWGRRAAIWVAALKIVLLITLYTVFALVVVPVLVQNFNTMFQEMFDEMAKGARPGQRVPGQAELAQMSSTIGILMTASAVGMIIFGAIYPIVVLIALTRPRVKAACALPASNDIDNPPMP